MQIRHAMTDYSLRYPTSLLVKFLNIRKMFSSLFLNAVTIALWPVSKVLSSK